MSEESKSNTEQGMGLDLPGMGLDLPGGGCLPTPGSTCDEHDAATQPVLIESHNQADLVNKQP